MRKIVAIFIVVIFMIGISACKPKQVSTVPEVKEEKQYVDAYGTIKALETKDIVIDFPAYIEKLHVKEGQKISKDDLIVTLNIDEYKSSIKDKELLIKTSQNELTKIKSNYTESDKSPELKKYLNDLKNAEDLYNKVLKEYEDKLALYNSGSIPKYEVDEFEKTVNTRKKDIENIKLSIESMKFNKQLEVDLKQANVLSLRENLQLMKSKLNKSYINKNQIISDVKNGVIYDIGYVQGATVNTSKKLLSILDFDSLVIQADVDEEFIKDVKLGAEVVIVPRADKSKEYKGKVTLIAKKAVPKNGEADIPVEISIDNKDDFLVVDINVDVKIKIVK